MTHWLSRAQDFTMNGPAPTRLASPPYLLPWAWMAAGEAMKGMNVTAIGNWPFFALSVILSVVASVASIDAIRLAWAARLAALTGSWIRCQLNLTAAASYGVPSVNLMPGWIFMTQLMASLDVSESAVCGTTAPVDGSVYISMS